MYADDLSTFSGSVAAFARAHKCVVKFCAASCMELNDGKCRVLAVGPSGRAREDLEEAARRAGLQVMGPDDSERLLGTAIGRKCSPIDSFYAAVDKMTTSMSAVSNMHLSIFGRALYANTKCMSLLQYTTQVSFFDSNRTLEKVWKDVNAFVSSGACFRSIVAYDKRRRLLKHGGLALLDIRALMPALHAMWVPRFLCAVDEGAAWRGLFLEAVVVAAGKIGCSEPFLSWPVRASPHQDWISSVLGHWAQMGPRACSSEDESPVFPALGTIAWMDRGWRYNVPALALYNRHCASRVLVRGVPADSVSCRALYLALHADTDEAQDLETESEHFDWLSRSSSLVPPRTRQFAWQLFHGKLYMGQTKNKPQVACSFVNLDGSECSGVAEIEHVFSNKCPTSKLCLDYFLACWARWSGVQQHGDTDLVTVFEPPRGHQFRDQWRWSLCLLLHCLWRARCRAHLSSPTRVATALSIILFWRAELALQLRLAFYHQQWPSAWCVDGAWACEREGRVSQVTDIAFPSLDRRYFDQHRHCASPGSRERLELLDLVP